MKRTLVAIVFLGIGVLACGRTAPRQLNLYPSPTVDLPTSAMTAETATPNPTQTPNFIVVSATPNATTLCVAALGAVYLRPSPSNQNYPIEAIPNETELIDLGGRSGKWVFVQLGDSQGWVNGDYLGTCK